MIYNNDFVWLHVPKCAGTKTENLFRKYFSDQDSVFQDTVDINTDPSISWHDSISDREARDPEFELGMRTVICPFRKLPSWLESRYNFELQRSPNLAHRPELLLEGKFLNASGSEVHADAICHRYLPAQLLKSKKVRFVRTEFFASDFKSIFGDYLDISRIPDWEYGQYANASSSALSIHIKERLYDNNKTLYEKCPYWRLVEETAYGP